MSGDFEEIQNRLAWAPGQRGSDLRIRAYKPFFQKLGRDVYIDVGCFFANPQYIFIEDGVRLNREVLVYGAGAIKFGRKVRVGPRTIFHSANHDLSQEAFRENGWKGGYHYSTIDIGDFSLISANCLILAGVFLNPASKVAGGVTLPKGKYASSGWIYKK